MISNMNLFSWLHTALYPIANILHLYFSYTTSRLRTSSKPEQLIWMSSLNTHFLITPFLKTGIYTIQGRKDIVPILCNGVSVFYIHAKYVCTQLKSRSTNLVKIKIFSRGLYASNAQRSFNLFVSSSSSSTSQYTEIFSEMNIILCIADFIGIADSTLFDHSFGRKKLDVRDVSISLIRKKADSFKKLQLNPISRQRMRRL